MRPILLPANSVNQRLLSGPTAMPVGLLAAVGTPNSVMTPAGVMRPIALAVCSVNQRLPSGPATMYCGLAPPVGMANSVKVGDCAKTGAAIATRAPHASAGARQNDESITPPRPVSPNAIRPKNALA